LNSQGKTHFSLIRLNKYLFVCDNHPILYAALDFFLFGWQRRNINKKLLFQYILTSYFNDYKMELLFNAESKNTPKIHNGELFQEV
jgi:hypothetical protein